VKSERDLTATAPAHQLTAVELRIFAAWAATLATSTHELAQAISRADPLSAPPAYVTTLAAFSRGFLEIADELERLSRQETD